MQVTISFHLHELFCIGTIQLKRSLLQSCTNPEISTGTITGNLSSLNARRPKTASLYPRSVRRKPPTIGHTSRCQNCTLRYVRLHITVTDEFHKSRPLGGYHFSTHLGTAPCTRSEGDTWTEVPAQPHNFRSHGT